MKIFLTVVYFLLLNFVSPVMAQDKCEGKSLQEKIQCYSEVVDDLGSQAKTLSGQIAAFDAQINLTSSKIADTEEKITLLSGRIDQLEGSLNSLSNAFSQRAVETYKMARVGDPVLMIISSENLSEAVSRFFYLKKIQEADRDLLQRLQGAQDTYKGEKFDQEELQEELEGQQNLLASQKSAKKALLDQTKNDEKKYQALLSEARTQLAALRRYVNSQGGATILENQTKCNSWGCYYNQRDSKWGNIGLGGSSYSVAGYGCLVSSVSMIASHNGKGINPGDIAVLPDAFVPGTGYLYHDFTVNGIHVTLSKASSSILDSELSAGRPVIAGLFSGPDHFIVILRKEGDRYIMHDPFMENGANKYFDEEYNVSDITSLRLVSF